MVIITLKGADKEQFGEKIVSNDNVTLKVEVRFKDGRLAYDSYPLMNVLCFRELEDTQTAE